MEFPHIGKHCSQKLCKKLDFLPMKCDACEKIFCQDHFTYQHHDCPSAYKKDVQVPVCPLCNIPIPTRRGQPPDVAVGAHMDSDCQFDPSKSQEKVFSNKCHAKACKQRELVPVLCQDCNLNYCLKHRHPQDHHCRGSSGRALSKAAESAIARQTKSTAIASSSNGPSSKRSTQLHSDIQGQMSEDEALSLALQASLIESETSSRECRSPTLEEEDEMLARAIAESEQEQHRAPLPLQPFERSSKERCAVS